LAELGLIRLVVCRQVFEEVERNLQAKAPAALPFFQQLRSALPWEVVEDPDPEQVAACSQVIAFKDAPILAAAISARPHRLVTLDTRDFGCPEVAALAGCPIQTPAELLAEIRQALAEVVGNE